ncbi:hypothetical protein SEUCBS139899_005665 [Sporothrix eucalyptigena]|uniref:Uncharacterized protein n=1 Tax=Sporothrix eucalyptigena TaxID=1812306 RepID=A0ABP0AWG3_9PEZI
MATPRVKRAFAGASSDPAQRQITSFFDRDPESSSSSSSDRPSYERRSSTPMLPPSVQANLLAVGMRVRKSVPEGYKTGKEEEEAAPRPKPVMNTTSNTTTSSASFVSSFHAYNTAAASSTSAPSAVQRELTPFCGLHKIGGLGVQSFGDSDDGRPMFAASLFNGEEDLDGGSEPPSLTSSQETVSSTMSGSTSYYSQPSSRFASMQNTRFNTGVMAHPSFSSTRKRFYGQEEDDDVEDDAGAVYQQNSRSFQVHEDARLPMSESTPSQASLTSFSSVNSWLTSGNAGRRVLAVPRRRQKHGEQHHHQAVVKQADDRLLFLDQENVDVMGDFGEADFLDASMLAQRSDDMEMGGM